MASEKKVLITGGSGFIGSHLKVALEGDGFEIATLGRGKNETFILDLKDKKLESVLKDFLPDIVFHLASGSNIIRAEENKEQEFADTVLGTECLIKALQVLKKQPEKFIYLSSQAVYGLPQYLPIDESHKLKPVTVYGENKLKAEQLIINSSIKYLIFRVSSVYGPNQNPEKSGVIAKFINKLKNDESPIVFNSLDMVSDFILVDDLVNALIIAVKTNKVNNEIFNLGSAKAISLKEILDILYKYFPDAPKPELRVNSLYQEGSYKGQYLDTSKIQSKLAFKCKYSIEGGLKEMVRDNALSRKI